MNTKASTPDTESDLDHEIRMKTDPQYAAMWEELNRVVNETGGLAEFGNSEETDLTDGQPKPQGRKGRVRLPKALQRRAKAFDDSVSWTRQILLAAVSSWKDAFAFAKWFHADDVSRCGDSPFNRFQIRLYTRCEQIYAEEVGELDRLRMEALARVADRINAEFPHQKDEGIADSLVDALREGNPQKWTLTFDVH